MTQVKFSGVVPYGGYLKSRGGADKLTVPVKPLHYLYTNFTHVKGRPAASSENGLTATKVKILDSMISRLSQLKEQKQHQPAQKETGQADMEIINQLIKDYSREIHNTLEAQAMTPDYSSVMGVGASGTTGLVVNASV